MASTAMSVFSNFGRLASRFSSQCGRHNLAALSHRFSTNATNSTNPSPDEGEQAPPREAAPVSAEEYAKLTEERDSLIETAKELDDKYKRALADAENMRVRLARQIEDSKVYGIQKFSKDLLEVADVLQTACGAVPQDELKNNEHLKNLYEGLRMTESQLQGVFRRHGMTQINPLGEKFDPNEHEAVFMTEDKAKEVDTVAVVSKLGYKLKERVIRPALVGVVKH